MKERENTGGAGQSAADERLRSDAGESMLEEGDDAPASAEENEGMSTVMSADPVAGVQKDDEE